MEAMNDHSKFCENMAVVSQVTLCLIKVLVKEKVWPEVVVRVIVKQSQDSLEIALCSP